LDGPFKQAKPKQNPACYDAISKVRVEVYEEQGEIQLSIYLVTADETVHKIVCLLSDPKDKIEDENETEDPLSGLTSGYYHNSGNYRTWGYGIFARTKIEEAGGITPENAADWGAEWVSDYLWEFE